jgi:hypothetical protein
MPQSSSSRDKSSKYPPESENILASSSLTSHSQMKRKQLGDEDDDNEPSRSNDSDELKDGSEKKSRSMYPLQFRISVAEEAKKNGRNKVAILHNLSKPMVFRHLHFEF